MLLVCIIQELRRKLFLRNAYCTTQQSYGVTDFDEIM